MIINPIDKSNYFKGLLVLAGIDKNINRDESYLIKRIGHILGFNNEFVDCAINSFFDNKFIIEDPPQFSNYNLAEIFIKDGIKTVLVNNVLNLDQLNWLSVTALKNNISKQWLFIELENLIENYKPGSELILEIQEYFNHQHYDSPFAY